MLFRIAIFIIFIASGILHAEKVVLGPVGLSADYTLDASSAKLKEFEKTNKLTVNGMQMLLGPAINDGGVDYQWFSLIFTRVNGQRYQLWALLKNWPTDENIQLQAKRYIWSEPQSALPLEYCTPQGDGFTMPYLWKYGWPRMKSGKLLTVQNIFPDEVEFLGHRFKNVANGNKASWNFPEHIEKLTIDEDLRIGYIFFRHDKLGRLQADCPGGKYEMVKNDDKFVRNHIAAGYNEIYCEKIPDWIVRTGCLLTYGNNVTDWPVQMYRGNYSGSVIFIDEPGWHNVDYYQQRPELAGKLTPAESAHNIQRIHQEQMAAIGKDWRSLNRLDLRLANNFDIGNLKPFDQKQLTWEQVWPTVWYQLAVNNATEGVLDEEEFTTPFVCLLNMVFGAQIPATVENSCDIRVATMRGACRNFNKKWGISIYTPQEFTSKLSTLKLFYDAGASYFRMWNHLEDYYIHVPYTYQRQAASVMRSIQKKNPNRDMNALLHAAKTAIVLPYGYMLHYLPMQRVPLLHLERKNEFGLTYRQVLSNAAAEVERCLRDGIEFDIVVDDPKFTQKGYEELVYIRKDGKVEIFNGSRLEKSFAGPREVERPDLGPLPKITAKVSMNKNNVPCKVTLTADPKLSTAPIAKDNFERPLVYFEIFTPDNNFIEQKPCGTVATFDAKIPGEYKVRVSTSDDFGRPAYTWLKFTVGK